MEPPRFGRLAIRPLLLGLVYNASAALYDTVIETRNGKIQGYPAFNSTPSGKLANWKDITVWEGIPFSASTGGQNCWKAPQPASPWNDTLEAKSFGNVCPSATMGGKDHTIDRIV